MSYNKKTVQSHTKLTPNEYVSYSHKRRQVYGQDSDALEHPSAEAERDYRTYSEFRDQSNASVNQYKTTYKRISGQTYEGFDDPSSKFYSLEQDQHQELVSPAAQAATDTNLHAGTRNAFLDVHRFAYQDVGYRMKHERLADNAAKEASHYSQVYEKHYEQAGLPPRRESEAPYGSYGSPVPPPQRPGNPRLPAPREAYGQASYSGQGSATTATSSAYRQSRSGPVSPSPSAHGRRVPSPSEAYGQVGYSAQGSATAASSSTYRQPRSDPRIPSPSEAYGQASYSTPSSARAPIPTSYDRLPKGSPPPPRPLFDSSIPTPAEAYPHIYGRRQHSRE